jgi:hypothetical protein
MQLPLGFGMFPGIASLASLQNSVQSATFLESALINIGVRWVNRQLPLGAQLQTTKYVKRLLQMSDPGHRKAACQQ